MPVSQDLATTIRNSVDIVEIVSGYIPLTQRGKNFVGVCPFHDDHSPSMSVSKDKQIYKCFSCGAAGNVINFVMDYEHVSFIDALNILGEKCGIKVNSKSKISESNKFKALYEIFELSNKFYQNNLNTSMGLSAKEYLKKRNIDQNIIKEFGIGLSLIKNDLLSQLLIKKYAEEDIKKTGLILKTDYGYHDIYTHRIMFPIHDLNGRVVAFSGRIYEHTDNSKYINSMESPIFKKGEMLYHYHFAREECRLKKSVIVMEGFMDVIRASTIGIKNTVATMGTAITKNQANLIKRLSNNVILCFDGDSAGEKATLACANELISIGVTPKVIRLKDNLDPDEYILKYGKDAFLNEIDNALGFMDFKMLNLKNNKNMNNNTDVSRYIKEVIDSLNKIEDDILKEVTINKVSKETGVDKEFLKSKLEKHEYKEIKKPKLKEKKHFDKYQKAEVRLIFYMLKDKEVVKLYRKKITYMPTLKYRNLARIIDYYVKNNGDIVLADFLTFITDTDDYKTATEIISLNIKENYTKDEIIDYINVIKEYNIDSEKNRLKTLMEKETDPKKKIEIAQKILDLKVRGERND
ncbi:MAG: DNA primase [Bacilli bacterium]|nr:DNA primase [Bacilli bacterium]